MRKLGFITIVCLLVISLCACGKKEKPAPTNPPADTRPTSTTPSTMPEMDPTLDTNIPDPTVNENSLGIDSTEDNTHPSTGINDDLGTNNDMNGLDNAAKSRMFRQ